MKYGKFVSSVYVINVIIQSFFSLVFPMLCGFGAGWLLVERVGAPRFLYPILITLGALVGLYSMIKFILETMAAVENLEAQQKEKEARKKNRYKNEKDGKK